MHNPELRELPIHEQGRLAGEMAIDDVIDRHRRGGQPIAILRDGKPVAVSVEEYIAMRAARKAKAAANGMPNAETNGAAAP